MNFQLRRFVHGVGRCLTFETFLMFMVLLFLATLTSLGLYSAYMKYERISRGTATSLTPVPADAELEVPRK